MIGFILSACFAVACVARGAVRPNIVVILANDLGYQYLGIQGALDVVTPHLDSLANAGIRCSNAYVTAPVCSPSRVGFLVHRRGQAKALFDPVHSPFDSRI